MRVIRLSLKEKLQAAGFKSSAQLRAERDKAAGKLARATVDGRGRLHDSGTGAFLPERSLRETVADCSEKLR